MGRVVMVGDERMWAGGHPPGHPLRPERLARTWELMEAYQALSAPHIVVQPTRLPTVEELTSFHTPAYVNTVRRLSAGEGGVDGRRYGFGPGDNPPFAGMYESEGRKVGAALVAAEAILDGASRAFSLSGGLHHAGADFASGFCIFGDGAIAIHRLLDAGARVVYIDIDAHHGDGVQAAFYREPRVMTISLHESGRFLFPGTGYPHETGLGAGQGSAVNLPLFPYADDRLTLRLFDRLVPPLVRRFAPDVVVTQIGVDTHWQDPLSHLSLTTQGIEALVERVAALSPRLLALGGGGYAPDVVPRAWLLAWGVLSSQRFPDAIPAPLAVEYDTPWLYDPTMPVPDDRARQAAAQAARAVIEEIENRFDL